MAEDIIEELRKRLAAFDNDAEGRLSQLVVDAKLRALEDLMEAVHDEQIKELDRKRDGELGLGNDEKPGNA
ncbi:MAG TPA: hypothetical protein VEC57_06635 [Candidatus Limnocylindrales bacterium]|nr:hypothetical protein [Candidatus Limnocylindrales bacterium]